MDIELLLKQLRAPVQEIELKSAIKLNIKRPNIDKLELCTTPKSTVQYCVCDVDGNLVFDDKTILEVDPLLLNEIFEHCLGLFPSDDPVKK